MVKNLPAMRETPVQSLGRKDPLGKGMATHSSILAWKIPWTERPGGLQSMGSQRVGHDWASNTHIHRELWRALCLFKMHKYLSNEIYTSSWSGPSNLLFFTREGSIKKTQISNYNTDTNYQLSLALSQIPEPTSRALEKESWSSCRCSNKSSQHGWHQTWSMIFEGQRGHTDFPCLGSFYSLP